MHAVPHRLIVSSVLTLETLVMTGCFLSACGTSISTGDDGHQTVTTVRDALSRTLGTLRGCGDSANRKHADAQRLVTARSLLTHS